MLKKLANIMFVALIGIFLLIPMTYANTVEFVVLEVATFDSILSVDRLDNPVNNFRLNNLTSILSPRVCVVSSVTFAERFAIDLVVNRDNLLDKNSPGEVLVFGGKPEMFPKFKLV